MRRPAPAVIGGFTATAAGAAATSVLLLSGCTTTVTGLPTSVAANSVAGPSVYGAPGPSADVPAPTQASAGPCRYTPTPSQPAPPGRSVGLPDDPNPTPNTGTVTITLRTTEGAIALTLNRAQAPCTVQSVEFLATRRFYDGTPCHRLTAYDTPPLKVLQCGDPTGTGAGGPGYTIPDEKPTTLLPAPGAAAVPPGQQASVVYPAGTIAMANTGQPGSGGSQFFLVYADSQLPPDYAVFGTTSSAGLAVLNQIAAAGITPGTDPSTGAANPQDGKPKQPVTIQQAVVAG
jgi:peptidyl-prolyl cis-trans isomerase B (cyclophilin B)